MSRALRTVSAVLTTVLAAFLTLSGCSSGSEQKAIPKGRPIVLISIDTLRSDHLKVYGDAVADTPAIDALRADGILYEHAYSPVPLTLPAHTSLFTGLLPPDHGVRDNAGYRLAADGPPTLAELLHRDGYATGGAVSAFVLRHQTGIARGFDAYDDDLGTERERATIAQIQRPGGETLKAALAWLDRELDAHPKQPFFLFFHIYEPHTPYEPPEPFASRYKSAYDGEIAASDQIVGNLLAALKERGVYDRSTVLLLSDHGEGLGDHGEEEHGVLLYRESIQVPLILKLPGAARSGTSVAAPVGLADVMPTLLSVAGAPAPEKLDGLSLLDVESLKEPREIYSETYHPRIRFGWSELRSLIDDHYHYIRSPRSELYDVRQDPGETMDRIQQERRVYAHMRDALEAIDPHFEKPFEETSETRAALTSLGYLGGTAGTEDATANPRDHLAALENLRVAVEIVQAGDYDKALPRLRQATEEIPRSMDAWQFLGLTLQHLGQRRPALDAYKKAFDLSNGAPGLAQPMAQLALELGDLDDGLIYLDKAIEESPNEPRLRLLKTRALLIGGRLDEAAKESAALLRDLPDNADVQYQAGAIAMGRKNLKAAEQHLRNALELAPDHPAALNDLAVLLLSQGRKDEARPLLQHLLEVQPGNRMARQALARISS